jgi:hypothetical protein
MNLSHLSDEKIKQAILTMQNGIAVKPGSQESEQLQISIDRANAELQRRASQKKSESQKAEQNESQPQKLGAIKINEATCIDDRNQPGFDQLVNELKECSNRVVEAPLFEVDNSAFINIKLASGITATFSKGKAKAECRRYFKNMLESQAWKSGSDKTILPMPGFRNLCAFFEAWSDLDEKQPPLEKVLPYYSQHKEGGETMQSAKRLYNKIISLI